MRLEGLYAITPDWTDSARLLAVTEAILAGGCRLLQYRNKVADPALRQQQGRALRRLTAATGATFIVNDDPELARAVNADGVHLGTDDGDLATARQQLGRHAILGATCYQSLEQARAALVAGADYVAFGSFFASPSKPQARRADPALLASARASLSAPVAAIGGITLDNARGLIEAGAQLLAVISALYDAPDPAAAAHQFQQLFKVTHFRGTPVHELP